MQRHIVAGRYQQLSRHVRLAGIGGNIVPYQVAHATAAAVAPTQTTRLVLFSGRLAIAFEQRGVAGAAVPPTGL